MPVSRIVALWTQTQRAIIPAYHDHVIQVRNDGFFNAYGQVFINGSLVFPTDIKYVIEIDCEGGTAGSVILKKTTSFEEDFIAYFHVESVIQDFLETDNEEFYLGNTHQASSINSIHLIQNFSKNKANLRRFTFLVRCEFVVDNVTYSTQNFTMPDNLGANRYYNQDLPLSKASVNSFFGLGVTPISSSNANFNFNATVDDKFVYTGAKTFTLANGSNLSDSVITLFQF